MEAHVLRFEADAVALNFLTQMGPSDGFITGAMVAKARHRTAVDSVEDDDPEDQYVI